jgi:hypothetical protein
MVDKNSDAAPAAANLETLSDLCAPWCIRVAATLRIADHIAAGRDEIGALANATGCDSDCLHALLTYLVGKGVFQEPEPGRFELNEAAQGLLGSQQLVGLDLNGIGGRMAHVWSTLLTYVQTGKPAYDQVFGLPFWEDLDAHPAVGASFDALIGPLGHGIPNPDFAVTGGWDSIRTVVDVGGGTGAMLAEILRKWPDIRGTLVDLPRPVAASSEIFRAAGVADRVTAIGQSFFDPLPAGADLYILRGVLNDWPDEDAQAILACCAVAARPNGRVIILKSVSSDPTPRGLEIEMVLLGGKHRTVAKFQPLAERAGLAVVAAGRQASGEFAVECRPHREVPTPLFS